MNSGPQRGAGNPESASSEPTKDPCTNAIQSCKMDEARAVMHWPLVTLDFEASSLTDRSYPIEVGVARWSDPGRRIMTWSTLIRPTRQWIASQDWAETAQEVHGIAEGELAAGMLPHLILRRLDDIVGTALAFCDGGINDAFWMRRLCEAAGSSPDFALGDLDALMISLPSPMQRRAETWLSTDRVEHRAGPDALRHMRMIAAAVYIDPGDALAIHI